MHCLCMLTGGTQWFGLRGGIGSVDAVVVVELCYGVSPKRTRGGGTEGEWEAEKYGVGEFGDWQSFVLTCKVSTQLDEVGVSAVFQQMEDVLPW